MTTVHDRIIAVSLILLLLLMSTEVFAGPQALGKLYLIGVYALIFIIICTLLLIAIIYLVKRQKLKSKFSKTLVYSFGIVIASIYLPTLIWFLWEAVFENVSWNLDDIIPFLLFVLVSFFILKKIINHRKNDKMPNNWLDSDQE